MNFMLKMALASIGWLALVFLGFVGRLAFDRYEHPYIDLGPSRPMTRGDVVCDADASTIYLKPGNYTDSISTSVELCGWWDHGTIKIDGNSSIAEPLILRRSDCTSPNSVSLNSDKCIEIREEHK